jgi:hypothetical protein
MGFPDPLRSSSPLVRAYTAAEWAAADFHLLTGEVGVETDTGREKIGVGLQWSQTPYRSLLVSSPVGITGAQAIVNVVTISQAAYDDLAPPPADVLFIVTPDPEE